MIKWSKWPLIVIIPRYSNFKFFAINTNQLTWFDPIQYVLEFQNKCKFFLNNFSNWIICPSLAYYGFLFRFFQMDLPNSQDLFFTSQIVSGGEIFVAYDNALRQYWIIVVNQVYIPSKVCFSAAYLLIRQPELRFPIREIMRRLYDRFPA